MTDLHEAVSDYLTIRRALGFKLVEHQRLLPQFASFLEMADADTVTTELAIAWELPALPELRIADREDPGVEVDVIAVQRERFTDPHTCHGQKAEDRGERRGASRGCSPPPAR